MFAIANVLLHTKYTRKEKGFWLFHKVSLYSRLHGDVSATAELLQPQVPFLHDTQRNPTSVTVCNQFKDTALAYVNRQKIVRRSNANATAAKL